MSKQDLEFTNVPLSTLALSPSSILEKSVVKQVCSIFYLASSCAHSSRCLGSAAYDLPLVFFHDWREPLPVSQSS